jgi:hypothetical protein
MATLSFSFFDRWRGSPRAVIYVKRSEQHGYGADKMGWITTANNLAAFELEIDRLGAELSEIRREAQLRFADHAAKRYRATRHRRLLFRIK